ncbi:DUF6752 domain-containing protein [Nocardioides sp. Kera G14]|uniref:DUF6752 domain-containing protein n=1 Tax=Nocardioides sp. Kera G14 TaxID=2884264 RepID=UPI001D11E344|nr:DUF6752 domain-containing protein [Nocardioides sp. Kera G14]UDY23012.1 hypothetical protein LH076_13200 [Nocardioides sp. Kera G14]
MTETPAKDFARKVREKVRGTKVFDRSLHGRVLALEKELEADRQLHRRIAELSDVVAELLVPIQDRDETQVREILSQYRKTI